MADPDKSLLDRLRALKPATSLTRPQPRSQTNTPSVDPTVRKDVLADRLRSLRDQAESASPPKRPVDLPQPPADTPPAQPRQGDTSGAAPPSVSPPLSAGGPMTDYDDLLETDDGVLEDLLRGPELDSARNLSLDARADLHTLRDLARQFSELARVQDAPGDGGSDDSGGEGMKREVEDILADTVVAAKVDEAEAKAGHPLSGLDGKNAEAQSQNDDGGQDPALSLPSVPTDLPSPTSPPEKVITTGDFDDDMARRMAALKNFKPSAQAEDDDPDALRLPSVPTFHPSERASARSKRSGGPAGRVGFTDDDMGTWCVVCLEDATLVCPGCDDDVYCSRCWFEMHEGPAAGFDERGHKAVRFNKDQKKKKVAVGA